MMTTKNGIDVSTHNGNIDWNRVKSAGIDFAILRAGYGRLASQKDECFEQNYAGAKAAGILVGAYWYSYAKSEGEARLEADAFLSVIKGKQFEFPVYYDVEEKKQLALGKEKLSAIMRAFLERVEAAGFFVGLYGSASTLTTHTADDIKTRYAIWLAHWVNQTNYGGAYGIWQHTEKGRVDGISGAVDLDIAYEDYPAIIRGTATEPKPEKSVSDLAAEVIAGMWGNGAERRERLTAAGYDYAAVQAEVNRRVAAPRVHVVRQGDTLSALARRYGTTVSEIVAKNRGRYPRIRADYICIGWRLTM